MTKDIWKHLRVKESTHNRVKGLAGFKGMKVDEVINYLLDKENQAKETKTIDYRKGRYNESRNI